MVYPIPAPSFYCPLPGTKSFDDAVALGHKSPNSFEEWSDVDYNLKEMVNIPFQLKLGSYNHARQPTALQLSTWID